MRSSFSLDPQAWAQLKALLTKALDVPAQDREQWLEGLETADAAFRPRLRALLSHAEDSTSARRLEGLPCVETAEFAPLSLCAQEVDRLPTIGPYRLLRELGSGGMASVWLAERTDMLQGRPVALKLPHGAWRRAGLAERMAREREILATLNHPNIATLFDAGLGDDGQPYLALEYVEGERIDLHCRRKQLDVTVTLRLFQQVARAVAHAHSHLVVHRDLKPSNILVTSGGDVKLLDFGIAKLLERDAVSESELTQQTGRALTPDYASPEQIQGLPVGTQADVYSLGVVLFELLAGTRPYTLTRGSRAGLEEAILNVDTPPPSRVAPPARRKALQGDLDTVVLKALAKAPAQRYLTAHAFAEDVQRWLEHRPVLAQPDRTAYRLTRYVRRNRVVVGAAVAVVGALAAGAGVAVWQAVQARAEQHRAEAVKSFVTSLLTDANPFATASRQGTVEGLLQSALERLRTLPPSDGALHAELLEVIGSALSGLGRYELADEVLNQAIAEGTHSLGEHHRLVLRARLARSTVHRLAGRTAEMRSELELILPHLRAAADAMPEELTLAVMNGAHLAIEEGRGSDAQKESREALAWAERQLGPSHPLTVEAALLVVTADQYGGDPDQVLASATRALASVSRALPQDPPHARVMDARFIHGRALGNAGRFEEAVTALQAVLQTVRAQLGADAPMAGYVAADLARFELALDHADASMQHARSALTVLSPVTRSDSVTMAMVHVHVGRAALALYQVDDARLSFELARASLAAARRDSPALETELSLRNAWALALLGRLDEAQREVDPQLAALRTLPRLQQYEGLMLAGMVSRLRGELDASQALLEESLSVLAQTAADDLRRERVQAEMARLWLQRGDPNRALALLPQYPGVEPRAANTAQALLTRGRALLALNRPDEARLPLAQAAQFWHLHGPGSRWEVEAVEWAQRAHAKPK